MLLRAFMRKFWTCIAVACLTVTLLGCGSDLSGEDMRAEVEPDTSTAADSVALYSTRAAVVSSVPALEQRPRTVEERLHEATTATRVRRALANDRMLYRYAFTVDVVSSHAVVEGRVASEAEREHVVELVGAIKGVEYVVNEVQID